MPWEAHKGDTMCFRVQNNDVIDVNLECAAQFLAPACRCTKIFNLQ